MNKKNIWQKIWEPEDSHLFGELFIIISAVLLTKFIEGFIPEVSKWLYLGIGFLLLLYGIKLLRKS